MKASKEAKVDGNFVGDGLTFGGLMVLRAKTGEVEYAFQARAGAFGATPVVWLGLRGALMRLWRAGGDVWRPRAARGGAGRGAARGGGGEEVRPQRRACARGSGSG